MFSELLDELFCEGSVSGCEVTVDTELLPLSCFDFLGGGSSGGWRDGVAVLDTRLGNLWNSW